MNNNKISVVINTYNASKFLARVLDSVKDFDEIVICDMESTDDTLEIAQRYGCKIVTFKKEEVSIVEPARGPSSTLNSIISFFFLTITGTISASKAPDFCAASAFN